MTDTTITTRRKRRGPGRHHDRPPASRSWLGAVGNAVLLVGKVLLPIILLLAVATGILYVRLLNGPVSLAFLSKSIEQNISSELPGFKISIGRPVVALRGHGFEFRLENVRLSDQLDRPIALAPLAAVEVSRMAFLGGKISPSRIVLIRPRMLVFYSPDRGISLSIVGGTTAQSIQTRASLKPSLANRSSQTPAANQQTAGRDTELGRIDLAQTIANLAQHARQKGHATSFLNRVGLRNATVIVDNQGARTALRVPSAEFSLAHSNVSSVLAGDVSIASSRGVWGIALRVEESQQTNQIRLTAAINDLYPQAIADAIPGLAALNNFRFPISAKADYVLSSEGKVLASAFDIGLGPGRLQLPWLGKDTPTLDSGHMRLVYRRGQKHFEVEPSTLKWAKSKITVVGTITNRPQGSPGNAWEFNLRSTDGRLSTSGDGEFTKIKRWDARGVLLPAQGIVKLDRVISEAGGGSMIMNGVMYTGNAPGLTVEGRFSPMSARNFLGFWPTYLGSGARKWAVKSVHAGQLRGGKFKMRLRSPTPEQKAKGQVNSDYAMDLTADLKDIRYTVNERLPPVFASKAAVAFKDDAVNLTIPQSAFVLDGDRSLLISDLKFETKDIFEPSIDGVAQFKIEGGVADGLDIVKRLQVVNPALVKNLRARLDGKIKGRFDVTMPFVRPGDIPDVDVSGQIRILEGRAKKVWRGFDVNGSNVILDVTATSLIARGELLLKGVPVKLAWRRQFSAPEEQQPPLRLQATLDEADRNQLGLAINHIVSGPMGIDITVEPRRTENAQSEAHVRIDLTNAQVAVQSVAWKKPIGRSAFLDFDVEAKDGRGRKISSIRLDGENVAMRGTAQLNKSGQLAAFDISDFAIDIVSRLQLKGELRPGNTWRTSVRGRSFEGREFFRSLFSTEERKKLKANDREPGLDLDIRIANVLGYWDTSLRDVRVDISKRRGKMTALSAVGTLKGGKLLRAVIQRQNNRRRMVTNSDDAGQVFKLIGFYPNMRNGQLQSIIELDGTKAGARRGVLAVQRFKILGDQILSKVIKQRKRRRRQAARDAEREALQFDWMRIPFLVGGGQFIMRDTELRGPLQGVLLCGKADFSNRTMQVAGTYIPLQGLSTVISSIPGIGNLLAGSRGEGVIGINFEVRGTMQRPEVLVNPLSAVTPGIFREIFQVACPRSSLLQGAKANKPQGGIPKIGEGWTSEAFQSSN